MILCNTNILIDFWKNPKELNKLNISKDKHSVCGIVKWELLHGAKMIMKQIECWDFFKPLI